MQRSDNRHNLKLGNAPVTFSFHVAAVVMLIFLSCWHTTVHGQKKMALIAGISNYKPGTGWNYGHLCHKKSKGSGGADTLENTFWGCYVCHSKSHNCNGKPCPPKVRG